jgi:hypothetical protein
MDKREFDAAAVPVLRCSLPQRGALAARRHSQSCALGICCAFAAAMSSIIPRSLLSMALLVGVVTGCRNPQDPSQIESPFGRDGGTPPSSPEVQPDTGKPIGPIADLAAASGGYAADQNQVPGHGGVGGGGAGGAGGRNRVASR